MNTVTLAQLRQRSKEMADMVNSNFISPTELLSYINESVAEFHDILVSRFEDYYTSSTILTITSGNTVSLPTDFYKLRGVDQLVGTDYTPMMKFNFNRRNRSYRGIVHTYSTNSEYRIVGDTLHISPTSNSVGSYQLWYVPVFTPLSAEVDTINGYNGWETYVILDVAIKMLDKEESATGHLVKRKKALLDRIEDMAQNRDIDQPETITDVTDYTDFIDGWR